MGKDLEGGSFEATAFSYSKKRPFSLKYISAKIFRTLTAFTGILHKLIHSRQILT
jgi:hypothetical protein